jgi:hypothetical protein
MRHGCVICVMAVPCTILAPFLHDGGFGNQY